MEKKTKTLLLALVGCWVVACTPVGGPGETTPTARRDAGSSSDSSSSGDAAVPCGEVTLIGECARNTLRWCNDGTLVEADCGDQQRICGLVDCDDNSECYGYDCIADTGSNCEAFLDMDDDEYVDGPMCEYSAGVGCLNNVCTASTSCTEDPDGKPQGCDNNSLQFCVYDVISTMDCTYAYYTNAQGDPPLPYICGQTTGGEYDCLGQEGGRCNPDRDPPWECAPGFTCTPSGTTTHFCTQ